MNVVTAHPPGKRRGISRDLECVRSVGMSRCEPRNSSHSLSPQWWPASMLQASSTRLGHMDPLELSDMVRLGCRLWIWGHKKGPSHICTMTCEATSEYARDAMAAGRRILWGTLFLQILHPLSMFTHALWYIILASVYAQKIIRGLVYGWAFQLLIFQVQCRIYNNHIKCFSNQA